MNTQEKTGLGVSNFKNPYTSAFILPPEALVQPMVGGYESFFCVTPPEGSPHLSHARSMVVNDMFAVFQTKASFFKVHNSLLRRVHQSAR